MPGRLSSIRSTKRASSINSPLGTGGNEEEETNYMPKSVRFSSKLMSVSSKKSKYSNHSNQSDIL